MYIGYWTLNKYYYYYYYFTVNAVRTLVQATVTARLDYCNSIYTNLPMKSIHRLQITQNSDAHLISRTPRHEHVTHVLVQLHWLPIAKRCQFKILTMTYRALHHNAPTYICDMLNWYQPAGTLRSASTTSLVPNRNRTIRYGIRLLDTSSAELWNPLPDYIKSADTIITFKTYLNTYMFII